MAYKGGKDKVQLFIIDDDDNFIINKPEVREIKEYKAILERDTKRTKFESYKELLYIYLMLNPASIYKDLPVEERMDKVIAHCNFEDVLWTPDELVIKAMVRYEKVDLKLDGLMYSYLSARRTLYSYGKDIDYLNARNESIRQKITNIDTQINRTNIEQEIQEFEMVKNNLVDSLIANNEKASKMIQNLPKAHDVVEEIYKKVAEESAKKDNIYGGGSLGNREA